MDDAQQRTLMARSHQCPTCGATKGRKCIALVSRIAIDTCHGSRLRLVQRRQDLRDEIRNAPR